MIIKTKRIYEPKSKDDGLRVLVTRYWPRGIRKDSIDLWVRQLGPSEKLIKVWKSGKITWGEFKRRYLGEYKCTAKQRFLQDLKDSIKGKDATLLCVCEDENRCHRGILKGLLKGRCH